MEENTQLPKEVVEEINRGGQEMLAYKCDNKASYIVGATVYASAYANRLNEANETIKVLTYDNNRLKGEVEGLTSAVEELKAQPGARWVKASEFKIEYGPNYYAKWLDGKVKATGHFQESDGMFFWNIPGYVPIGKNEYEHLYILDESAAGREGDAVGFAEWCANNYSWEFDPASDEYQWLEANNFYTTTELYAIFKQQKEK